MKYTKKKYQSAAPVSQPTPPPKTAPSLVVPTEVNAVQSAKFLGGKRKGKNKSKKPDNQQEGNKSPNLDANSKGKRKLKYPYLIYGGDHFTKEFPHHEEVDNFLKGPPTTVVLKDPFLTR